MLDDVKIKTLKLKVSKAIELLVNEQQKDFNWKLVDVQLKLENVYDVLNSNQRKNKNVIDTSTSIANN
jgi:hypothetical protein